MFEVPTLACATTSYFVRFFRSIKANHKDVAFDFINSVSSIFSGLCM